MEHMAKLGRGAVAYLDLKENAEEAMATFFAAVSHPAMTDLAIDFGGVEARDVYPKRLPDLFVGRPVTVVGRLSGEGLGAVKVTGKVRGETGAVEVGVSKGEGDGGALPAVWARMKIAELGDRLAVEPGDAQAAADVRRVALDYGLMSAFPAFVAVDATERTKGAFGTTVATPVPVPEGVRYETAVPE
jgi:Ca-activated chloride channel family protein